MQILVAGTACLPPAFRPLVDKVHQNADNSGFPARTPWFFSLRCADEAGDEIGQLVPRCWHKCAKCHWHQYLPGHACPDSVFL